MLDLAAFKGKEVDVPIRSCPSSNFLFGFVVGMLEKTVSQVESTNASCYGLINIKINQYPGKVSPWIKCGSLAWTSVILVHKMMMTIDLVIVKAIIVRVIHSRYRWHKVSL